MMAASHASNEHIAQSYLISNVINFNIRHYVYMITLNLAFCQLVLKQMAA